MFKILQASLRRAMPTLRMFCTGVIKWNSIKLAIAFIQDKKQLVHDS